MNMNMSRNGASKLTETQAALPIPPRATRNLADLLYERASHDADEEASSPLLQPVTAAYLARPTDPPPSSRAEAETAHAQPRISPRRDQGLGVLGLAHVIPHFHVDVLDSSSDTLSHGSPAMTDSAGPGQSTGVDHPPADHHATIDSRMVDAKALASAALEATTHPPTESREPAKRVDSAQDELPKSTAVKPQPPSGRATPLKLHTGGPPPGSDDTITTSPTLARHAIPVSEGNAGTLPALHSASPSANAAPTSPSSERLPSFRQLTGQLTELADAAGQHEPRVPHYGRHHSQSFGSATAPSPMLPYHIPPNTQMSPSSQYAFSARSPTSAIGDHYSSPTQIPGNAYYMERRTSNFPDHPIGLPASLPSASSSGESHGPPSSSADGYSTAHTTPVDSAVIPDGMQRNMPILPPPRGMPPQNAAFLPGGFKCDYPGCEAAPFATQYLLSSHRNVHSSVRPHYCPVEGCQRAEGGKGFKRKNEMIRHGLVHNSPGYVCPFCPEREHKYPRPDNLQRHVRVHHAEKDRDDPLLREVLNQRTEGALGKTRRKRANTGPC